jgi:hypothetical protein
MESPERKSNRQIKVTQELLDGMKRRKEGGESGRQIALSLGNAESTLRKSLLAVSYAGYFEINLKI